MTFETVEPQLEYILDKYEFLGLVFWSVLGALDDAIIRAMIKEVAGENMY